MLHGDIRDIQKITKILAKNFPEEIIISDINKADFADLQEKHLTYWRLNKYDQMIPVRSIGLQVTYVF